MEIGLKLYNWMEERNLVYPMIPFMLNLLVLLTFILMKEPKADQSTKSLCSSCIYKRKQHKSVKACTLYKNRNTQRLRKAVYCCKERKEEYVEEQMKMSHRDKIIYTILGIGFIASIIFAFVSYDGIYKFKLFTAFFARAWMGA